MGAYIHVSDKETWLMEHAIQGPLPDPPGAYSEMPGFLSVCLVVNTYFTAAGIVFDNIELERFTSLRDPRPKTWYWVSEALLHQVSPELTRYQEKPTWEPEA